MSSNYLKGVLSTKKTPQSEPIPDAYQVKNSAGGYSFQVDKWKRLERFVVLSSEGGSYYCSEKKLTLDNAKSVKECLDEDGLRVVQTVLDISENGRAPKNTPALFVLAMAAGIGSVPVKQRAFDVLPRIARTGTMLFEFCDFVQNFRGWGRGLRKGIGKWYSEKNVRDLAYQVTKYQNRNNWSHGDLLRQCHVKAEAPREITGQTAGGKPLYKYHETGDLRALLYRWILKGTEAISLADGCEPTDPLAPVWAMERAKKATTKQEIITLIKKYNMVRECIPTNWLTEPDVWAAMLEHMPLTAMVRNLGVMSARGLLAPLSDAAKHVQDELGNVERLRKSRLHPLALLMALRTYAQGRGEKGKLTWTPVPQVMDALNDAFYAAFDFVEPTGKRWLLGIDVSGSMGGPISGGAITCCEAATAMAMVTLHTEPACYPMAFNQGIQPLPISKRMRLDGAMRYTRGVNFGGTDCALPMIYALQNKIPVDVFVVLTDSETWAGHIHPTQAIQEYRNKMGIGAKLIVTAMVANPFTIADPNDAGMLDVVGFDTNVPAVFSDFAKQ